MLSALAVLLHLLVIAEGPSWYRFFGAGEELALAAERGSPMPAIITFADAAVLALWSFFALSAAGYVRRLPLLHTVLAAISAICLSRGLAIVPIALTIPDARDLFAYGSSLIVLAFGCAYALGRWLAWSAMRAPLRPAP